MYRYLDLGVYMAMFIALVDQGSKWWMQTYIVSPPFITVEVGPMLNFILRWNKGVTFGLMAREEAWMSYAFIGAAVIIIFFLLNWMMRATSMSIALGLGLVMGGAIGNVMDRIRYGAVLDFVDAHWGNHHWYTFNFADAAIVCGVGLLLLETMAGQKKTR